MPMDLKNPDAATLLVTQMRKELRLSDRWYRLKKIKNTFLGSECLEWMMASNKYSSKQCCLRSLNELLKLNYIENACKGLGEDTMESFVDGNVPYRFSPRAPYYEKYSPCWTSLNEGNKRRTVDCLLGAFLSDAASSGYHTTETIRKIQENVMTCGGDLAFWHAKDKVTISPCGYEAECFLDSLIKYRGLDCSSFASQSYYMLKKYQCNEMNPSSLVFMENMENGAVWPMCGSNDNSAEFLAKIPIITALYAGSQCLLKKVEESIRIHQNSNEAIQVGVVAAKILERIIFGESFANALSSVLKNCSLASKGSLHISKALKYLHLSTPEFSRKCKPGAIGSFHIVVHILMTSQSYGEGIRTNILTGKDITLRASFIGACLAAEQGIETAPKEWKAQVRCLGRLRDKANSLLSLRDSPFDIVSTRRSSTLCNGRSCSNRSCSSSCSFRSCTCTNCSNSSGDMGILSHPHSYYSQQHPHQHHQDLDNPLSLQQVTLNMERRTDNTNNNNNTVYLSKKTNEVSNNNNTTGNIHGNGDGNNNNIVLIDVNLAEAIRTTSKSHSNYKDNNYPCTPTLASAVPIVCKTVIDVEESIHSVINCSISSLEKKAQENCSLDKLSLESYPLDKFSQENCSLDKFSLEGNQVYVDPIALPIAQKSLETTGETGQSALLDLSDAIAICSRVPTKNV